MQHNHWATHAARKYSLSVIIRSNAAFHVVYLTSCAFKGDSNPNDKYVLSERALWTMNFDTSIIKIGWKMGKLWAFKKFNMANI